MACAYNKLSGPGGTAQAARKVPTFGKNRTRTPPYWGSKGAAPHLPFGPGPFGKGPGAVRAGRPRGERTPRRETKSKEPLNNSLCSVPTRCISRNLPLVKMISAQNSHYLSAFLLLFLKKGRLPPVSGYGEFSPGHGKRIQIGTSEHGVQSVLVFLQTTIHGFPVAELTLDDPERVLYFAAHR